MGVPEDIQKIGIGYLGRVKGDTGTFGVTGISTADLVISGMNYRTSGISGFDRNNAL